MQKTLIDKYFTWGKFSLGFYTGVACGIVYDKGYKEHIIYIVLPFFMAELQRYDKNDDKPIDA